MANIWEREKVRLRPVRMEDVHDFYSVEEHFDTDIQQTYDEVCFPMSHEDMKNHVEKLVNNELIHKDEGTLIVENEENKAVGCIYIFSCSRKNGTFWYGVKIRKDHHRKRYASQAIDVVLNYYFNELRYNKANVYIHSFNTASVKLHEKLGFKCEGRLREAIYTNGQHFDDIYYGITKSEYNATKSELSTKV